MATRQYGDFIVQGGHVHAGDTVLNINIGGELIETANCCRVIDAALAKLLDPPTYLGEIRNDIEELLNAIDNIQACIDENSINEAVTSSRIQSNLLDLWMSCRTHKQALVEFETVIGIPGSTLPSTLGRTPHVQYAGLRGALRGLRRRLNTSIAILHLSTLQNMRLASEQHWSQLRRQIENLQELCETQALASLPTSLPISRMNLSRLELPEDPTFGIKRLLHTNLPTLRSNVPSMQLSNDYSSSLDRTETFISAMEYHPTETIRATSIHGLFSGTIRPVQAMLLDKARSLAVPEVTTLHASTTTSSSWRRQPWLTYLETSISHAAPDALLCLQRRLCGYGYSLLQSRSECQYRSDSFNNHHVQNLVKRAEKRMLPVFAEVSEVKKSGKKRMKPIGMIWNTYMNMRKKSLVSSEHSNRGKEKTDREIFQKNYVTRPPYCGKVTLLLDDSDLETMSRHESWPMNGIILVEGTIGTVDDTSDLELQVRTSVIPS